MKQTDTKDREFEVTRIFNAPVSLVWDAWTIPEHIVKWWGPDGFTNTIHHMEVKPGGVWNLTMHAPGGGRTFPNLITYKEVEKNKSLVYDHTDGTENFPGRFEVTVTFTDLGEQTRVTMYCLFFSATEFKKVVEEYGALEGNRQTLDKLEAFLNTFKNEL